MDIWIIYTKELYEKKKANGTIESLTKYAKEMQEMDIHIYPDYLFSIVCESNGNKIYYNKKEIKELPKIVFFKKYDLYLSRQFELLGVKVLNSSESMSISRNKLRTYQLLASSGIKVPKTIYLSSGVNRRNYTYDDVSELLDSKVFISKPSFGSKGKNISLIKNKMDFKVALADFKGICLFQEFIDTTNGKDLRSYVMNNKYQGSAIRINEHDFRTNYNLGAKVLRLQTRDDKLREVAESVAKAIGLWYCAVDILYDGKNYYVCEVNSIPGKTRKINSNSRLLHRLKLELEKLGK